MVAGLLVAGGVVAAAVLVDSDDSDGGGTQTAPGDLEIAELEPALLTQDDVGGEFSASPSDDDGDDDPFDTEAADTSEECRRAMEQFEATDDDTEDNLMARFERASDNVSVEHELSLLDPGEPTVDEIAGGLRQCERIAYEDEGQQVEMRMAVDEVDGLGDEAIGVAITIEVAQLATVDTYGLIVARDGVGSSVYVTGPFDPADPLAGGAADRDMARDLAATADERLQRLLD